MAGHSNLSQLELGMGSRAVHSIIAQTAYVPVLGKPSHVAG